MKKESKLYSVMDNKGLIIKRDTLNNLKAEGYFIGKKIVAMHKVRDEGYKLEFYIVSTSTSIYQISPATFKRLDLPDLTTERAKRIAGAIKLKALQFSKQVDLCNEFRKQKDIQEFKIFAFYNL